MNKAQLLRLVQSLPDNASDIDISVDVSTSEHNAFDRVFVHELRDWQYNGRNHYTILATGKKNF